MATSISIDEMARRIAHEVNEQKHKQEEAKAMRKKNAEKNAEQPPAQEPAAPPATPPPTEPGQPAKVKKTRKPRSGSVIFVLVNGTRIDEDYTTIKRARAACEDKVKAGTVKPEDNIIIACERFRGKLVRTETYGWEK